MSQKNSKNKDIIGTVFDAAAASASSPYDDAHEPVPQQQAGRSSRNSAGAQMEMAGAAGNWPNQSNRPKSGYSVPPVAV